SRWQTANEKGWLHALVSRRAHVCDQCWTAGPDRASGGDTDLISRRSSPDPLDDPGCAGLRLGCHRQPSRALAAFTEYSWHHAELGPGAGRLLFVESAQYDLAGWARWRLCQGRGVPQYR